MTVMNWQLEQKFQSIMSTNYKDYSLVYKGHKKLVMGLFDRSHMAYYLCSVVTIAPYCTVTEILEILI